QQALEWAFATECAQLDFDQFGAKEFERPAADSVWRLQKQRELGCRVDGGGASDPHPDAQIIAAAVEALPTSVGGRAMAMQVAELARARSCPDWGQDERQHYVPQSWAGQNQHGPYAATRVVGLERVSSRRGMREVEVLACPVMLVPSAAQIAAKRRNYLAWYGALLHLMVEVSYDAGLDGVSIVDDLPALAPWHEAKNLR
ncbi:hypothetical protein, partial [Paracoccus sp. (in: a-proteobacteria)]|uniref:hypothetical protein n=1 Tax=Paracoccus sp. TaxID=267 RepID=UPI00289C3AA3